MSTPEELKALGNKAFAAKDFQEAIDHFSKAIEASTTPNHVLYSNRSACYTSLKQFEKALEDANKCVEINPTWAKGYNRVAAADYGLIDYEGAEAAYKKALELDPANKMAKDGLEEITKSKATPDFGLAQKLTDPNLIEKLKTNPKTAEIMKDPTILAKVQQLQSNPSGLGPEVFLSDQRLLTIMGVLLGIDMTGAEQPPAPTASASTKAPAAKEKTTAKPSDDPEDFAPDVEMKQEPKEVSAKEAADEIKVQANALYKKRKFDEAIELYDKAYETHPDITYLNNRAAAEFEKGDYKTAIKTCDLAIEKGREERADYKVIAKSFSRIGTSYTKLNDLKQAIYYFDKSLTEHRTADVLTKLRNAEKALKKKDLEEYVDPEKAEAARLEGKEYFTKADWPNAVKAYTEMIKRSPSDARGYSNRAAAFTKLMSFPEAIKDCDTAIEKDPLFLRAFIRKASAQLATKDFKGCIDTLDLARVVDSKAGGKSAYEINQLYQKATSQRFQPVVGETSEQTMERVSKDPEVVSILQDPVMQNILQQAKDNPAALQDHMKNPEVFKKINILIAAGVIRTG